MLNKIIFTLEMNKKSEDLYVSPGGFELNKIGFDFYESSAEQKNNFVYEYELNAVDYDAFPEAEKLTINDFKKGLWSEFYIDYEGVIYDDDELKVNAVLSLMAEFYDSENDCYETVTHGEKQLKQLNSII